MAKNKEYKYPGELATLIEPPGRAPLTMETETWLAAEAERIKEAKLGKVRLLSEHHGVDPDGPDALMKLLLALIDTHVPGVRVKAGVGRGHPRRWTASQCLSLIADVKTEMEGGKLTKTEALRRVGKRINKNKKPVPQSRLDEAFEMPFVVALLELGMDRAPASLWWQMADAYADTPELDRFGGGNGET